MNSTQGFYKLKGIKDRSNRLEDCAKKQNGYQDRRLNKYLVCIKKEHEGNMDKFKTQERELMRRNSMLAEYLQKEHERREQEETQRKEQISNPVIGLPNIEERRGARDGVKGSKEGKSSAPKHGGKKGKMDGRPKMERRGSVNIQLLHVVGSTNAGPLSKLSDSDSSRPSTAGLKLPPLREELAANRR